MTDKVQKIREEVQRLQDLTMDENKNFYSEAAEGEYNALCNIEHFIDSLQEEPEPQFKVGDIIRSKVWERAVHEIVSMDDSAYYFENGGKVEIGNQELWELAEEPVSEELEKVAEEAAVAAFFVSPQWTKTGERLFKAGALWQKQQDSKLPKIWDRETLDEYAYQVAYDLSNDWMRETATWDDVETAVKLGAKWQKKYLWKPSDDDELLEYEREVVVFTQNFPDDAGIMTVAIAHRPDPKGWDGKSLASGKVEHYTPQIYDKGGWNIPDVKYWLDCDFPKEKEE